MLIHCVLWEIESWVFLIVHMIFANDLSNNRYVLLLLHVSEINIDMYMYIKDIDFFLLDLTETSMLLSFLKIRPSGERTV